MEFENKNDLLFYNNISDSIIVLDDESCIIYANDSALKVLGVKDFKVIEGLIANLILKVCSEDAHDDTDYFSCKEEKFPNKIKGIMNTTLGEVEVEIIKNTIKIDNQIAILLVLKNLDSQDSYFKILNENQEDSVNQGDLDFNYTILSNKRSDDNENNYMLYKAILEATATGVVIEKNGKIKSLNKAAEDLIGIEQEKGIIGKRLFELIEVQEMDNDISFLRQEYCNYNFKKNLLERKIVRKDGKVVYCEISPMCFRNDEEIYSIFLLRDITRRVNGEKTLISNRDNYVTLLKSLPFGVMIYTDNMFELANDTQRRILGIDIENIKSIEKEQFLEMIHSDYIEDVKSMYYNAYFKGRFTDFREVKLKKLNGDTLDIEMATMGINITNGRSVIILCQEITERKKAQLNKLKLEQAIKYDKLKTEFISNMSHELKTPLNIILSTIQVLQHNYKEDDHLNKYLDLTKVNSYRLLRLINNLIDVTRIDVGNLKMNFGNYDIVKIVEDITMAAVEYVESKGMTLVFDTDVEEKIIGIDKSNIERIVLNLLSNAVKFSKEKGTIMVEVHDLDDRVQIQVKDDGIGIPEDMQDKIFDKFVQSEELFTRSHEGSGIGLALVKSIVENHGGRIYVDSIVDGGSQFTVELPNILSKNKEVIDRNTYSSEKENAERIKIEFSDIYK